MVYHRLGFDKCLRVGHISSVMLFLICVYFLITYLHVCSRTFALIFVGTSLIDTESESSCSSLSKHTRYRFPCSPLDITHYFFFFLIFPEFSPFFCVIACRSVCKLIRLLIGRLLSQSQNFKIPHDLNIDIWYLYLTFFHLVF